MNSRTRTARIAIVMLTALLLVASPLSATAAQSLEPSPPGDTATTPAPQSQPQQRAADAEPARSAVGITKETNLDDGLLVPGSEFVYTITVRCSGLTVGCINQSVTDVLPEGLDVTSLPTDTDTRSVTYDAATRTLTVTFSQNLQEPVGGKGINDGATEAFDIGMRLPANTDLDAGDTISNTATTVADNADEKSSTTEVAVSIPREVKPVATKTWADGSAVAGTGETSIVTLGIRNASSKSADVEQLTVTDDTRATFESFDLTDVAVAAFPAGTDTAHLLVCTEELSECDSADYVAGPAITALGDLSPPAGTDWSAITAFSVVFTNAAGNVLPYDATGGTIKAGFTLRDTVRSSDALLTPTTKQTVKNCATPGAIDSGDELTEGAAVCASYDILPDTVVIASAKTFFADTDGNFAKGSDEHAVIGESSPVSATISLQNKSAFPLREIRIVEPDADSVQSEFEKLDTSTVRLRLPSGATSASLLVTYDDGSTLEKSYTANSTQDVRKPGTRVASIEVVYTGEVDGAPSIAVNATAYLDLHGTLNDKVDNADLNDGVGNCAAFTASANTSNSTGTTAGNACASLPIEAKRLGGDGIKTVGQRDVPPGQPIPFTLRLRNSGNVAMNNPVMSDPVVDDAGVPLATNNPFDSLQLTSATIRKDSGTPDVTIEVFDPSAGAWVAHVPSDTELTARATGVRAVVDGALTPGKNVYLDLVTQRRDGVPDGVLIENCFVTSADGWASAAPSCSTGVSTAPSSSTAAINKSITPGTLPKPIPGLEQKTAAVRLSIANTGNMNAKRLQLTDEDADFFDAVDFGAVRSIQFPNGADRVQIDVKTAAGWTNGTPVAPATSYPLPAVIDPAAVVGVRVTFSSSSDGYTMRPCEGTPTPASCTGVVVLDVHPRETLRSAPGTPIPDELANTLGGAFETLTHTPGSLQAIPDTEATIGFTKGTPELDVEKTPNSAIAPGQTAPFELTVTNSGESNLPDLVVKDLLPKGLELDETFAGDDGQPFRIVGAQVPDGTEPVPAPTFSTTTDSDRVSGLVWTFGEWVMRPGTTFRIQIQVRLAPGVTEGQVNTNLMGASSSIDDLRCAPGTGTQADGDLGDGRYCTDTASITTKAGAAFSARKWVAGNDDLGWYNNRTQQAVAVGDDSCPQRIEDDRAYTAYPCIALVNPGDRFDYVLRMVNSGTEAAQDMRIVDRFPVAGDKGVVLDSTDRGTQWGNRPTLASEPTLRGAGTLTSSYAHSEAGVCTDDLLMGDDCADDAWADPYSDRAVAAQMRVHWDTPLAPGDGVSIAFSMTTPLEVEQVADPTIAWNSFGHAERTIRANGGTRVLPPTEPIQVGVATAYGTLEVVKELLENPGELPVGDTSFGFAYRCTIEPVGGTKRVVGEGTLSVRPGESARVTALPAGADCLVWETDTAGGISTHPESNPARVTIAPQLGADPAPASAVSIGNSFPLAQLDITKTVDGAAAEFGEGTTFSVEVLCTMDGVTAKGFPTTVELTGNDTTTIDAPVGSTCTATETEDGGATSTAVNPGSVVITGDDDTFGLEVTNTFEAGTLQIVKHLSGAGADLPAGPFEFTVECTFEGQQIDPLVVTLARDGDAKELSGEVDAVLPVGALCLVTETDTGGADETPAPVTVVIAQNDDDNTVRATFTNEFSAGTVSLAKALSGDGADEPYATSAVFTVDVVCALGDESQIVYSNAVQIRGGEKIDLLDATGEPVTLPLGTHCWADESDTGGATAYKVNADSFDTALVVEAGTPDDLQQLSLEVVNTFDLSELALSKVVDGEAARYADGREYTLSVTCVLPQGDVLTPLLTAEPYVVTADEPVTIDRLPVGAECWAAETDAGGATHSTVDVDDPAAPAVVVAGDAAQITATNTFDAGELTIGKRVVNGGPGPYSFELQCRTDQGEVSLDPSDAGFRLAADEERTVIVPLAADCTVTEVDVPVDATVGVHDSDGDDDGTVRVDPSASVTITNTFPAPIVAAGSAMPGTGGAPVGWIVAAVALLTSGVALVGAGMRRRRS